jgi:hypothetical protein
MQTPEQSRQTSSRDQKWKVVTSIATVAAFGFGGIAIASPGQPDNEPPPAIEVVDKRPGSEVAFSPEIQTQWEVVPSPSVSLGADHSLDSPFDEFEAMDDSPIDDRDDSVDDSVDQDDSPDDGDDSVDDSVDQDDSPDDGDDTVDDSVDQDDSPDDGDDSVDDSVDQDDSPDDGDDSVDDSVDQDDSPDDD